MQIKQTHTQQQFHDAFASSEAKLRRIAYRLCRRDEDAEDLIQETMFKAWRAFESFKGDSAFATWVTRIMVNTWKDALKKQRVNVFPLEQSTVQPIAPNAPFSDVHDAVNRMLGEIPEQQRAVFVLRCLEDVSVKDTAAMLDIAEGTVKVQYFRALKRMRELLGAEHKGWMGGSK